MCDKRISKNIQDFQIGENMWKKIITLAFLSISIAQADDGVDASDTIVGKKTTPVDLKDEDNNNVQYEDGQTREFPDRIYEGAEWLNMSPEFVWSCWLVMESLYKRDDAQLERVTKEVKVKYPRSGIIPTARALKWQVMMLENFDFRYEKEYKKAFNLAQQELESAMLTPGNDAWETFLLGAILGVDGIHAMRKEEWFVAINRGYEAMKNINKAKELAPGFIDSQLGDGLWLYWRSVIAKHVKGIPAFKDQRKEGIEMMLNAEKNSAFLRPAASLALIYTWIEEGKLKRAEQTALRLQEEYPDNIINLQVLGRVQMYRRKYSKSERNLKDIFRIDPKNERVHYHLSRLFLRKRSVTIAEKHMLKYLEFDIEKIHRAYANYHLGRIYARQKKYKEAEKAYKQAWKYGRVKNAQKLAKRMKQKASEQKK